jgi:hypothetical protein
MSSTDLEAWFVRDARVNAAVVWLLAALLVVVAVLAVLAGAVPGAALAATAAVVAVVPAVAYRSWTVAVPWPLLLLASLPLWLSSLRPSLFGVFVTGISVAALAMLVVVVLQMVTRVRMTPGFAVFFVVIATLATAAVWAVGSAVSARYLGTAFVETNDELMVIFSAALVAGLVAGGVFLIFFRRRLRANAARTREARVA